MEQRRAGLDEVDRGRLGRPADPGQAPQRGHQVGAVRGPAGQHQDRLVPPLQGRGRQQGAMAEDGGLDFGRPLRFHFHRQLVGAAVDPHGPALQAGDLEVAAADGAGQEVQVPAVPALDLDVGEVGMVGAGDRADLEAQVQAGRRSRLQGLEEALVGERQAQEALGEGPVGALLGVGVGVRAVGIEGAHHPRRGAAGQGPDRAGDMEGAGGVGTGRAAHHRSEHVVEDADSLHSVWPRRFRWGPIYLDPAGIPKEYGHPVLALQTSFLAF